MMPRSNDATYPGIPLPASRDLVPDGLASGDLAVPDALQQTSHRIAECVSDQVCEHERHRASRRARFRERVHGLADKVRPCFTGLYAPRTWAFWRAVIVCFCVGCLVGHWMEVPYCTFMDLFGIVEDDYAVWSDPWFHPYWVYGFGSVGLILGIEPLKERIIARRKTLWGAFLQTWVVAIFLSMVMELAFGLIVNQPNAAGEYPFWDNSELPLNIFGQAWLVNDVFIGLAGMAVIWVIFPLVSALFRRMGPRAANCAFAFLVAGFALCCIVSYAQLGYLSILP